ncbi:MAG TPA: hypothetical protein VNX68_07675 [Nitrosopumilaceae archaeon]|jgi:hypothetical protein|nr:hypothetical protein [Nitrosopumilaceae archaeon]
MKALFSLLAVILSVLLSMILILPYEVHVIRDVAQLYHVEFVTALHKEVIFGALILIALIKMKIDDKDLFGKVDKDEDSLPSGLKSLLRILACAAAITLSWGVAYMVHGLNGL